jgi:hypothetical protein
MFNTLQTNQKVKALTGTSKKKFFFVVSHDNQSHNTSSFWDGGSRAQYLVLNFKTGERKTPKTGVFPMFQSETILQENEILIQTGISVGKKATPCISCRASDEDSVRIFLGLGII